MKQIVTRGIVLHRTNFGEADRILTIITPDQGKLRLMAKGVRREKSKLAGGVELLSVSDITFIPGKRDIGTLISARLVAHYGNIVKDINLTTLAYSFIKVIDKATEDDCEAAYYNTLESSCLGLNTVDLDSSLTSCWFYASILGLLGHQPNIRTDVNDKPLQPGQKYTFNFEHMAFEEQRGGKYGEQHIKLLRLACSQPLSKLGSITNATKFTKDLGALLKALLEQSMQIRI